MIGLVESSGGGRVVSPRHRRTHLRRDRVEILALMLRLAAVSLLGTVGWIHLHLWQEGYRHIPNIGPLFLAGAVSVAVVGAGLLARPSRLIAIMGFGVVVSILAGLIVSINVGLFGFKESLSAPFAVESAILEIAAALTLSAWIVAEVLSESHEGQGAT
jgi:hypothetical protein